MYVVVGVGVGVVTLAGVFGRLVGVSSAETKTAFGIFGEMLIS